MVAKLQVDPWTAVHNLVYVHSNHITVTAGAHDTMNAPKVLDYGASIAVGCARIRAVVAELQVDSYPSGPYLAYVYSNHGAPPAVALGPIVGPYVPDHGASDGAIRIRVRAVFAKLRANVSVAPGPRAKVPRAGSNPGRSPPDPIYTWFQYTPKI